MTDDKRKKEFLKKVKKGIEFHKEMDSELTKNEIQLISLAIRNLSDKNYITRHNINILISGVLKIANQMKIDELFDIAGELIANNKNNF